MGLHQAQAAQGDAWARPVAGQGQPAGGGPVEGQGSRCQTPDPCRRMVPYPNARAWACCVQMPEEFNFDPDIMELKEEIKAMQQEFIELHKSSDAIKNLSKCVHAQLFDVACCLTLWGS